MPDLVAHVPEQRPVRLAHLLARGDAAGVVGLGEIERDQPVGVAGHHRRVLAGEQVEAQPGGQRQLELAELDQQPALRPFGAGERGEGADVAVRAAACGSARS